MSYGHFPRSFFSAKNSFILTNTWYGIYFILFLKITIHPGPLNPHLLTYSSKIPVYANWVFWPPGITSTGTRWCDPNTDQWQLGYGDCRALMTQTHPLQLRLLAETLHPFRLDRPWLEWTNGFRVNLIYVSVFFFLIEYTRFRYILNFPIYLSLLPYFLSLYYKRSNYN